MISFWWHLTLTFDLKSYFDIFQRNVPAWEISSRHAANSVRARPYLPDRGWQRADWCSGMILIVFSDRRCPRMAPTWHTWFRYTDQSWRQVSIYATHTVSGGVSHGTTGTASGTRTRTLTRNTSVLWNCCMAFRYATGVFQSSILKSALSRSVSRLLNLVFVEVMS